MSNVISMAEQADNALYSTPETALKDALRSIENGKGAWGTGKKALLLCLDDSNDRYELGFINAGMSCSEIIALLDIAKTLVKREMGY